MGDILHIFVVFLVVITNARSLLFDELYMSGITAYFNDNWSVAIENFEKSLKSYREYKDSLSVCSLNCTNKLAEDHTIDGNFIGKITYKGLCLKECLSVKSGDFKLFAPVSSEVISDFEKLMPYQYLQFAYYQKNMIAESVSAAYTYNLRFPDDEMMSDNMKFFRQSEDVSEDMFVNREAKEHFVRYDQGYQAYLKEDYASSVKYFEEALDEYYKAVNYCYGLCEGRDASSEKQWSLEFYKQNAYHYVDVLECSLKCIRDLSTEVDRKYDEDLVALHYQFLQYACYQVGDIEKAAQYAQSYLIFHPNQTDMTENIAIIAEDIDISNTRPSKQAVQYFKRTKLEAGMLEYSWNYFGMKDKDWDLVRFFKDEAKIQSEDEDDLKNDAVAEEDEGYESMKEKTDDIISKKSYEIEKKLKMEESKAESEFAEPNDDVDISWLIANDHQPGYRVVDSKYVVTIDKKTDIEPKPEGPLIYAGASLLANSSLLKGRERFAVDGIVSEEDCQELIDLAVGLGKPGDGYSGKESPHTRHEKFEGVSVLDAVVSAKAGNLPPSVAKLYYDVSEKVRAQAQAYFKLSSLYFDYTHLVCRTAKSVSPSERNDLSHPVHADNCLLNNNAECKKEPPAYIWRDYSAILYLNDDFDGGEFIFTDSTARRVRVNLKPKCGRMVSFSAGKESLHGVKPVLRGRRCAVALWFTLEESKKEIRRQEAKEILHELLPDEKQKDEL